jgi:hypothetical protein
MNSQVLILSSNIRASIFLALFGHKEAPYTRVSKTTGFAEASLRQELCKPKSIELVSDRRSGNRVYYRANRDHPLSPDLHHLVIKTVGLIDLLVGSAEQR